jgi:hypothetical protein
MKRDTGIHIGWKVGSERILPAIHDWLIVNVPKKEKSYVSYLGLYQLGGGSIDMTSTV